MLQTTDPFLSRTVNTEDSSKSLDWMSSRSYE